MNVNEKKAYEGIEINVFGSLRQYMDQKGLPYNMIKKDIQNQVIPYDIILELGLPPEKVEAVFCNGKIINIYDTVFKGDRVSFFPYGTPGPYRVFLGMFRENEKRKQREQGQKDG